MLCSFVLVNETLTDFFRSLRGLRLWTCYVYSGNGLWKEVPLKNFKWSQEEVTIEEIQISHLLMTHCSFSHLQMIIYIYIYIIMPHTVKRERERGMFVPNEN